MTTIVLCILWLLWPVIAFTGGLSYPIFAGLAAVALLPAALKSVRPRVYMGALLAFFVFAGVSAFWSPRHGGLVDFDFAHMKFAVRSEMIRVGLLIVAIGALIAATNSLDAWGRVWVTRAARAALLVQLAVVTLLTLYEAQALNFFSFAMPEPGEGIQNISRNSIIMVAAAPVLAVDLAHGRMMRGGAVIAAIILAIAAGICYLRDVNAGVLATLAALSGMAIVRLFPQIGFKVIAVGIAVIIVTAPWIFGYMSDGANYADVAPGDTVGIRFAIWNHAIDIIREKPLWGHGLGALRTMTDTIESGAFAGQLQMPNHPHNAMLQIWAETGGVGAGLLALAIVFAGWRLPAPWLNGAASLKGAAIAGAFTAIACVSFDLWNEWWWAVGGLLVMLAIATPVRAPLGEDRMIGVPVDAPQQPAYVMWETFRPGRDGPSTNNNFNLLRLAFALMVALFHLARLPGLPAFQAASGWLANAAEIGVQGFFILSGYLVYASLERTTSLRLYAEKRVRRLYPAYATVIVLCTVAALLFSPAARAAPIEVARYLGWNLAFLNFGAPSLPGVFDKNPVTEINGALWTLKIEVMFYLLLPLLAWVLRAAGRRRWLLIGLIYVAAEAWRIGFRILGQGAGGEVFDQLYPQLPGQMSFFITGIGLRILDREGFKPTLIGAGVGLAMIVATLLYHEVEFLRAAGIGLFSAWIALGIPRLFDASKFGDLSYGIYIVHFPVIQTVVALGLFTIPFVGLGVAAAVTLTGAILLWHFVEKPFLRGDSAYRRRA